MFDFAGIVDRNCVQQLAYDVINSAAKQAVVAEPSPLVNLCDILFEHCRFPEDVLQLLLSDGKGQKVVGHAHAITALLKCGPSAVRAVRFSSSCVLIVADAEFPHTLEIDPVIGLEEICGVVVPSYLAAEPVCGELPQERAIGVTEWRVSEDVTLVCLAEELGGTVQLFRNIEHLPANHDTLRNGGAQLLAVAAVDIRQPINTAAFEAWLACCLHGSPTCLVFFFDGDVCKGMEFVYATALPVDLPFLAEKYAMAQGRLDDIAPHPSAPSKPVSKCFEPAEWRERAHQLVLDVATYDASDTAADTDRGGCAWKALLYYRAAVRLAQGNKRVNLDAGEVPQGVRWTALSMGAPLRVRQYMSKALNAAPENFTLLRASALEFHADSYLALPGTTIDEKEASLCEVLRSLGNALELLSDDDESRNMSKRLVSKSINAQIMLAKLYQHAPTPRFGDALARVDQALSMETNVLLCASFSHLKAMLLREFVCQVQNASDADMPFLLDQARIGRVDEYEPKLDPERWLSTSVTLCLKAVRLAESHPLAQTVISNAKSTLALSYMGLGHVYARTMRYTKCQILAKQGIELFSATGDWEQVLKLQVWQGKVRLGWILCDGGEEDAICYLPPSSHTMAEQVVERVKKAMHPVDEASATIEVARVFLAKVILSLIVSLLQEGARLLCSLSRPSECTLAVAELACQKEDFELPVGFSEKVMEALRNVEKLPSHHRLANVANMLLACALFPAATRDPQRAKKGHGPVATRARRLCALHLQNVRPPDSGSCILSLVAAVIAAKLLPAHQRLGRLCATYLEHTAADGHEGTQLAADSLFRQEIHDCAILWLKKIADEHRAAAKQAYCEVITSWQLNGGYGRPTRNSIETLMSLCSQ